ncbi:MULTISPECIES: MnhB domain-containing protein [unclassified Legionella]|uniref:MnhB domain-containing protein n=1 Tax=unclassified Legionella TaxID=2622702 RepID=UPI001056C63C|nr:MULTISPECIES: MnhB domain-containing protein [unclassified Legionella]MDI9819424.1 MnhB domain-containing protein [Legionella sp. PL877]
MKSLILQTIARILLGWMLLFSLWVLFRGHNAPGGGFLGGLVAASALSLYLLAYGLEALYSIIKLSLTVWLCIGLILLLCSGLWGLIAGSRIFLSSVWSEWAPAVINSPLLFDIGIYLITCFSVLFILVALEKAQ